MPLLTGRETLLTDLDCAWPVDVLRAWLDHGLLDDLGLISRHRGRATRYLNTSPLSCMLCV